MTSPMIEKAARALCETDADDPDRVPNNPLEGPQPPRWTRYVNDVRTVLLAIREADEGMLNAAAKHVTRNQLTHEARAEAQRVLAAALDHILGDSGDG